MLYKNVSNVKGSEISQFCLVRYSFVTISSLPLGLYPSINWSIYEYMYICMCMYFPSLPLSPQSYLSPIPSNIHAQSRGRATRLRRVRRNTPQGYGGSPLYATPQSIKYQSLRGHHLPILLRILIKGQHGRSLKLPNIHHFQLSTYFLSAFFRTNQRA